MKIFVLCIAAALCVPSICPVASSSEPETFPQKLDSLSMDEAVKLAIQFNPELKAARREVDAASARTIQAKLFPNPSLFLETEDGEATSYGFGEDFKSVIGLSQSFPLGGKIRNRKDVAEKEKEAAILLYEQKVRNVIAETKKTFVDVLAAQQLYSTASDNFAIARNLYEAAKSRVEASAAPETEQTKAEIELSQATVKLNTAKADLRQSERQLATVLGNLDLLAGQYSGSLHDDFQKMDLKVLEEKVLSSYPELLLSKAVRTASEAQVKLARAERYPDLEIGVGAGRERGIVENSHTLEWAVSIPLPIFDRNQGRILEMKMLELKAEEEYRSVLNNVRLNVKKAFLSFENVLDQVRAFKEMVLPQAEKSLALMMEGYQVGKFTHIDLLDAQRTLTDMRENYINLLRELNGMAIEIERFAGQPVNEIR